MPASDHGVAPLMEDAKGIPMGSAAVVFLATFVINMLVSIVAPFFPQHAQDNFNASSLVIGVIFAAFPFTQMIFSPIFGTMGAKVGRPVLLYAGTAVLAGGTLLFGLSQSLVLFFVARVIQGIGGAAMATSSLAMLTDHFPTSTISSAVGVNEACTGIGFMVGPPLGGLIYSLSTFEVPFISMAGLALLLLAAMPFLVRMMQDAHDAEIRDDNCDVKDEPQIAPTFSDLAHLLCTPGVAVVAILTCLGIANVGFFDPVYADHASRVLGVSTGVIGVLFVLPPLAYAIAGGFAGQAADEHGPGVALKLMHASLILMFVGWIVLGPAPFLSSLFDSVAGAWISQIVGLLVLGTAVGLATIPAYGVMLAQIEIRLPGDNDNATRNNSSIGNHSSRK
eukprot:TRINITY_DN1983_c0_g2_i5.p1 TRINITY_DN1983_c0_g2~~TRINITY_DN1983_c0_g2_i5.p1  ORF type:complete len:393 (+),score=56.94 TRINITY_DN1983_c0_g2_i5:187-1365(+)